MPIQESNIVYVEHQVMDDVPEGGGAATGRQIVDGQMNNIFPDTTDLDRAMGRFQMRKLSVAVRTLDTAWFGGAKTVVASVPEDPAIGYALFTTPDPYDTRTAAANYVEGYLFKGPAWHGALLEEHQAGSPLVRIIQRVNTELPPVGKTLCLVQNENLSNEMEQYIRVIDIDVTLATFTDSNGDFQRWVITLTLSDPLRHAFSGHSPNRYDSYSYTTRARLRDTAVADAARYYGAQPLTESASIGDLDIRAATMFAQLVPSAQTETPHVAAVLNPEVILTLPNGTRPVDVPQQAHTYYRQVTAENRSAVHVLSLAPAPALGTLTYYYMAEGNWYALRDDGTGNLAGADPSHGIGSYSALTQTLSVSLGALPDVGSIQYVVWGSPVHYVDLIPPSVPAGAEITIAAPDITEPIEPGTLSMSWTDGTTSYTVADDGEGALTGDAIGRVDYATPAITLTPAAPPNAAGFSVAYTRGGTLVAAGSVPNLGPNVAPGTVAVGVTVASPFGGTRQTTVYDDAQGNLRVVAGPTVLGDYVSLVDDFYVPRGAIIGSVNYATGAVTLAGSIAVQRYGWSGSGWALAAAGNAPVLYAPEIGAWAADTSTGGAGVTATVLAADYPLSITVDTNVPVRMVANGLQFDLAGRTFIDRAGVLYTDIDPQTGAGIAAGAVDYRTRRITVTHPDVPVGAVPVITAALGIYGDHTITQVFFRAAASPLKPESLQITATALDGTAISVWADADGNINTPVAGTPVTGHINYQFGFGFIDFGREVLPETIRYNAVSYTYLPLPANILGIDPVRLPPDGRVPVFRKGDILLIMHSDETTGTPALVVEGEESWYELDLPRTRIAWVRVTDANGARITEGFDLIRGPGKLRFASLDGLALPLTVRHTVADLRMATDVQISGAIRVSRALSHNFPAGSIVASCLLHGDRRARVSLTFDQATWSGTSWLDVLSGSPATATLNLIDHPITVTNEGCDTDRWAFRCTNAATHQWELISEARGLVWSGTYAPGGADVAPINPRTRGDDGQGGVPYLTIPGAANGGGWANGNIVRINTIGAIAHFWVTRSTQQSDPPEDDGLVSAELMTTGNVDNPIE